MDPNEIIQSTVKEYMGGSKSVVSKLYQGIARGRRATASYINEGWEKELNDKITN